MEPAWSGWPCPQLTVDVADVGATDHEHVDASRAEGLDAGADVGGVGPPVGHGRAVPVHQDRLERPLRDG